MTNTIIDPFSFEGTLADRIESGGFPHARTLIHEDGSHTFVYYEEYIESWMSPRECDGNVVHLVQQHRDYVDLDEAHDGIEYAAEQWGIESELTRRYVAMFCNDVAYFVPRWEVQGASQGDWQYGYAYVLWSDLIAAWGENADMVTPDEMVLEARLMFKAELKVYRDYFAGDVYYAVHLAAGDPLFEMGDEGAYYTGEHKLLEDTCGGFLGYDDMKEIGAQFTGSPVVSEEW